MIDDDELTLSVGGTKYPIQCNLGQEVYQFYLIPVDIGGQIIIWSYKNVNIFLVYMVNLCGGFWCCCSEIFFSSSLMFENR